MYEFGMNGALLAGDAEPDPRLCAAQPDRVDFDNGCQFCQLHENPRGRPFEDFEDYEELELELNGVETFPEEALCPMNDNSLNKAMVASVVAPVVVFILISALTAAYLYVVNFFGKLLSSIQRHETQNAETGRSYKVETKARISAAKNVRDNDPQNHQ